jgi:pSer/pThr/pTyr-binding forkhead associated (FHA) protein
MPAGASLEVLESVTRMPRFLSLDMVETRVGRSPAEADIVFENDITVSRLHASIIFTEGEYRLYDEQSTSGTLLNGQGIPDYGAPLIDGDEIRFGAVRSYFRLGGRG